MDLDIYEVSYFIEQVGLAAASFGVTMDDVNIVGKALMSAFGYRCAPPAIVIPAQGAQLQSICSAPNCPISPNATCSMYQSNITMPSPVSGNGSMATASSTKAPVAMQSGNAGVKVAGEAALAVVGVAAAFFL